MIDGGFDKDRSGQLYLPWPLKAIPINMTAGDEEEGLERNPGLRICARY
jgi:hypothetical protein